jgi:chromate reductase
MRVLGIPGSLRDGSHNVQLLRAAARALPPEAEFELFDGMRDIPLYNADLDDGPPGPPPVARLRAAIADADAIIVSTPEYNASIPGVLKNAIDWISCPFESNEFRGKPILVIGASTSLFGAVWAQAEVRKVLKHIGGRVIEADLPVPTADTQFDEDGNLKDPGLRERLGELVNALVAETSGVPAATAAA